MRAARGLVTVLGQLAATLRLAAASVVSHPGLALFSLASAFALWFLVQDVENPRVVETVPAGTQGVAIQVLNLPDGYIVDDLPLVRVRVEAREAVIPGLRAGDFRATVDLKDVDPAEGGSRPVHVESRRDGVRVLSVEPEAVEIRMTRAVQKEVRVSVRRTGELPDGFNLAAEPAIEPAFVIVSGHPELVESVEAVSLDVDLAGVRSEAFVHEGPLAARTAGGNVVTVGLSTERARASFTIAQTFTQRGLAVLPLVAGVVAPGFRVASVTWDPPVVNVTGPRAVVESLAATITTERLDVTGARADFVQTKQLEKLPNVIADRQTVVVRVRIEAIECGSGALGGPCPGMLLALAPQFESFPPGFALSPGATFSVQARVSGTPAQLAALKPGDVRAVVSLAGGTPGSRVYPVTVTVPAGLRLEGADTTLQVTLVSVLP